MIIYHGSNQDFDAVDLSKYKSLHNSASMRAENAEFIVDEYYRGKNNA